MKTHDAPVDAEDRPVADAHYTPDRAAMACLSDLEDWMGWHGNRGAWEAIEPSVGGGAFARALRTMFADTILLTGVDTDPDARGLDEVDERLVGDFLNLTFPDHPFPYGLAIGNPPFGGPDIRRGRREGDPQYVGAHHVRRCIELAPVVGMILPLEWLGVQYVQDTLWGPYPPAYFRVLRPRVWECLRSPAWFVWHATDDQFKNRGALEWR